MADPSLSGVQVHQAIIGDRFRDACQQGDLDTVHSILESCDIAERQDLLHQPSSCTGTPLFDAIFSQQYDVVKYLLDEGSDVGQLCEVNIFYPIFFRDTCAALCLACACGDADIVRLLLEGGAAVNQVSRFSTPLMYASEYNNVLLVSLLLDHGADAKLVPQSVKMKNAEWYTLLGTEAGNMDDNVPGGATNKDLGEPMSFESSLPLFQACLNGHKDTAELLMYQSNIQLKPAEQVCLLRLLGAQCNNKHLDQASCISCWRQAFQLESSVAEESHADRNIARKLEKMDLHSKEEPTSIALQGSVDSVFKNMQLCKTIEELDEIASNQNALRLQSLLMLESILGPSHPETAQQISMTARMALELGELDLACRLFLYTTQCHESRDKSSLAIQYSSQLADLLLNIFTNTPENLKRIENFSGILLILLELTERGIGKMLNKLLATYSTEADVSYFEEQLTSHSCLKILMEQHETLMSFLRMIVEQKLSSEEECKLRKIIHQVIQLKFHKGSVHFNPECKLMNLMFPSEQAAQSTLYFFQDELFPDLRLLKLLLQCGASPNCQDKDGRTPLHYAVQSMCHYIAEPVQMLLQHGAHIDVTDRYGDTPYHIISKWPLPGLQPFKFITLKCLASRIIMTCGIPYKGQVPKVLEKFVPLHGINQGKTRRHNRSASVEPSKISSHS